VWIGLFAFAVRIYCDFSGYSDMALGSAHLLGYKLTINFRAPYLSKNISEFWRRWHISLSNWLRDYIFIPLGGSRGSPLLTARNLMITMLIGGLWHGANLSFIIWGGLHGLLLVSHRYFRDFAEQRPRLQAALQTSLGTLLRIGLTFLAVSLCWAFFQPSWTKALVILEHLLLPIPNAVAPISRLRLTLFITLLAIGHLLTIRNLWKQIYFRTPAPVLGVAYAALFVAGLVLSPDTNKTFIYFQF
jgi:alginate O-acetyltransferase complex protein AlgI